MRQTIETCETTEALVKNLRSSIILLIEKFAQEMENNKVVASLFGTRLADHLREKAFDVETYSDVEFNYAMRLHTTGKRKNSKAYKAAELEVHTLHSEMIETRKLIDSLRFKAHDLINGY